MALARKYGRDPYHWDDVAEFVLKLSTPQFYNDPVVKYGYMRGQETADYVRRIRDRWSQYSGVARSGSRGSFMPMMTPDGNTPHRAHKRNRFKL